MIDMDTLNFGSIGYTCNFTSVEVSALVNLQVQLEMAKQQPFLSS